jgi:hypothetical protein
MSNRDRLKKLVGVAIDAGCIGAAHGDDQLSKGGLVAVCCTLLDINPNVGLSLADGELAYAAYNAAWEITNG